MYYLYIYKLDDKYPPKEREIRIFTIAKQGQYLDTYIGEFDSYGQAFSAGEKILAAKKCQHPPDRLYSWFAYDGTLCIGCRDCGDVLRGKVDLEEVLCA